jgi:hypothetical protein
MNALTKVKTQNPSVADVKVRSTWDRAVRAVERADLAFTAALKKAHRIAGLFEEAAPDVPEIDWTLIGDAHEPGNRTRALLYQDIDQMTDQARRRAQWTFPHPRDEAFLLEIAKVREYRLMRELLDARLGYTLAQQMADEACDRRTNAEGKLILTPAPDLDAVQHKLEYLFGDLETGAPEDYIQRWCREYTDALIADVRRLNQQQKGA